MAENTNDKNRKQPNQKPDQDQDQRQPQSQSQKQPQPKREDEIGSAHQKQSNSGQSGSKVGKGSMEDLGDDDAREDDVRENDEEEDRITQRTPSQRDRDDDEPQKPMKK